MGSSFFVGMWLQMRGECLSDMFLCYDVAESRQLPLYANMHTIWLGLLARPIPILPQNGTKCANDFPSVR